MTKLKQVATASLLFSLIAGPAFATDAKTSPAGSWQSADGKARVHVTMCGDGKQLCARLTGLAGDARTPANLQLLNAYVVDRATLADTNVWEGKVHFNGETADGHITMISSNSIKVSGCQLGMCKTLEFRRVGSAAPASTVAEAAVQMPPRTVSLTLPE